MAARHAREIGTQNLCARGEGARATRIGGTEHRDDMRASRQHGEMHQARVVGEKDRALANAASDLEEADVVHELDPVALGRGRDAGLEEAQLVALGGAEEKSQAIALLMLEEP